MIVTMREVDLEMGLREGGNTSGKAGMMRKSPLCKDLGGVGCRHRKWHYC